MTWDQEPAKKAKSRYIVSAWYDWVFFLFPPIAALVLGYLLVFVVCDHWLLADGFGRTARIAMLPKDDVGAREYKSLRRPIYPIDL